MDSFRQFRARGGLRRAAGWILAALVAAICSSDPARRLSALPGSISLTRGQTTRISLGAPLDATVGEAGLAVLVSRDERVGGETQVALTGRGAGSAELTLSLFGVPIKRMNVTVSPERTLTPGGQSIGVAMAMAGVLVVGASDVGEQPSPARLAGLRPGDLIREADGEPVDTAARLSDVMARGQACVLSVERAGRALSVPVEPVRDARDGAYRLGAWVRDSTAGVGTLSFSDPATGAFGALGHAITDQDTGTVLSLAHGSIYESRVLDVLPGLRGEPGELLGEFFDEALTLGDVRVNGEYGIYGRLDGPLTSALYPDGVPVRARSEVRIGPATVLTTLDGEGAREYACEITRLYPQDRPAQRGMVVRMTDPALLEKSGGIVQGMSGSPILQDGCIVGAITHVFLNDPTQGYGMYVEWMTQNADRAIS